MDNFNQLAIDSTSEILITRLKVAEYALNQLQPIYEKHKNSPVISTINFIKWEEQAKLDSSITVKQINNVSFMSGQFVICLHTLERQIEVLNNEIKNVNYLMTLSNKHSNE